MPAAIIALLTSLLPLLPTLGTEIQTLIDSIGKKGLTNETRAAIHALAQSIHQQAVDDAKGTVP